jgi:pimeloyl-ACP methyl ester carboxylesterase
MHDVRLETRRGRFAALRGGRPGATPLLALHGWLDNAASFLPVAPWLTPHFDLVALDFPGHGYSPHRPKGSWYHFVDWLDDVLAAIEALGWSRCHLLGHSLGGAVASAFAAAAPERIDRLVLIEALGPLPAVPGNAVAALRGALQERSRIGDKRLRVFSDPAQAIAARMQANDLSEAAARLLVERALAPVEGGFVWRSDARLTLTTPQRAHEDQVREWVRGIEAPSLVIAADPPSAVLQHEQLRARFGLLRDGRVVHLAGHHHLHMENPQPVAQAILEFLAASLASPA